MRLQLRTIYSPASNQSFIRIKPNENVIGIFENSGVFLGRTENDTTQNNKV